MREALRATREGRWHDAASIVKELVQQQFSLDVRAVSVSQDGYSLNSVNGFLTTGGGEEFFFKFHHEEGEEHTLQEFYRGELLKAAGFPVDVPLYASRDIGRQILLYRRRNNRRFADVCRALELSSSEDIGAAVTAQAMLDDLTCSIYLRTLHASDVARSVAEPVHQLFHRRLVSPRERPPRDEDAPEIDGAGSRIGGRARRFFWGADYTLADLRLTANELRTAQWRINGIRYADSIDTLLTRSLDLLEPTRLANCGAVTAHGDAHNANVWWEEETTPTADTLARSAERLAPRADTPAPSADTQAPGAGSQAHRLTLFDPAFAGEHMPALLAEVKATFHNGLAHPFWLYDPKEAERRYAPTARWSNGIIEVTLDWRSSALREAFLALKAERIWRPLLAHLNDRGMLGTDWRATLRCALFCCPALVMELRAGEGSNHNPVSSLIGLSVAVMAGSEPVAGADDQITRFLDRIGPEMRPRPA